MEKKTMHIVTVTKKYDGIDIESANVIGAYESIWDARSALEVIFHKICDKLCIKELNAYSYQEEDSFLLRTSESVNAEYKFIGKITTIDTETEYLVIFDDDEHDYGGTTEKTKKVYSLAEITVQINKNIEKKDGQPVELIMLLNGGLYSRKSITLADEVDENGFGKFEVFNFVDDTTQILSLSELFDETKTNLGKAINAGAVFMVIDDDDE
jgi:hypothetical protein